MVPARHRPYYFPVLYVQPHAGNEIVSGYDDLANNTIRRDFFLRAASTGELTATPRLTLIQETSDQYGILIIRSVYRHHGGVFGKKELLGFAVGVLRIGDVVEKHGANSGVDLTLTDLSSAPGAATVSILEAAAAAGFGLHPIPDHHRRRTHLATRRLSHARRVSGEQHLQLSRRGTRSSRSPCWSPGIARIRSTVAGRWSVWSRSAPAPSIRRSPRSPKSIADWRRAKRATAGWSRTLPMPSSSSAREELSLRTAPPCEMFAFDPTHDLEDHSLVEFVAPEHARTRRTSSFESSMRVRPGSPRERPACFAATAPWWMSRSPPPRSPCGRVRSIQVVLRDISQRKRDEAENARLISAIEQVDESIVITDLDANIVYVNPAFERITGYSREEVLGKNPRVLKSGRQPSEFYARLWKVAESRRELERPLHQPRQERKAVYRGSHHLARRRPLRRDHQLRGRQARRHH